MNPIPLPLNYSSIECELDTGDIFTFHGTDPLDFMIELGEGDEPYSHVGMVLKFEGELYFWDAPGDGKTFPGPFISLLTPDGSPGCRVAKIRDVMAFYMSVFPQQEFFWRQLKSGMTPDRYQQLIAFIQEVNGSPFPSANLPDVSKQINLGLGLFKSYFAGIRGTKVEGSYYCAQLTADSYLHMGLINPDGAINGGIPNAYTPADFDSSDPNQLPLSDGVTLGEVILMRYDLPVDLSPPPAPGS